MKKTTSTIESLPDRAAKAVQEFYSLIVSFKFPAMTPEERAVIDKLGAAWQATRPNFHGAFDERSTVTQQAAEYMRPIFVREIEALKAQVARLNQINLPQFGLTISDTMRVKIDRLVLDMEENHFYLVQRCATGETRHPHLPSRFIEPFTEARDTSYLLPDTALAQPAAQSAAA